MENRSSLLKIMDKLADIEALVIGDVMLDRFVYGRASRISPEAPIPILSITHQSQMPGGAGNVVRNIASLGGRARLVSVVGEDAEGIELEALFKTHNAMMPHLVKSVGRPTTVKTRFIADGQQLLRGDHEASHPLQPKTAGNVLKTFQEVAASADIIVLSDYAKGVLSDTVLRHVIAHAKGKGIPVIADPKSRDFSRYAGVTLLTPNRKEMVAASGMPCDTNYQVEEAARSLMAKAGISAILVTRSEAGMSLVTADEAHHIRAEAQEVFDVSGAGDSVVAALALAVAAGASLKDAARIANLAGGIAVSKSGTAAVTKAEVKQSLHNMEIGGLEMKVTGLDAAMERVSNWRSRGLKVGFTNGCFDLVHPGHISLIRQAKAQCDRLIVGLNTDDSIRRLKGPERPITHESARAVVLAGLADVDLVVPFAEDTPIRLIETIQPDVLIKGADYTRETVVGADMVEAYGGRIFLATLKDGFSTTGTIQKMLGKKDG
ncbi:MAG: bifunctional heptose 7-phosphate kinase/heptose 1-phosphate adenyltransferase [Sneathiella sp.]|jgi:D-beta-D-heptose 7-phosphate kinase/D-beta-D-heptose 1-phosphate adenosyltransferase|uniref:D-glycero-beta-D-manno-heptose-7-phosphate kinase n=1 Tax=Sneathiella sp. TaxID=1964365 RepID=UPI000C4AE15F|nr:D-glycero-beta-D-manno-heptose-7-phosphate kinase [Sneathiella sp.]MAL79241.1 bifunctional heptose 7-phosphate kinase/heptose 1-phosphate adenyltransferase [Sneathiella sp.]|tara:strand:+ start:726 stop:2198 length:1473 start_codon:yes stop_codon:yes gene_type:complete